MLFGPPHLEVHRPSPTTVEFTVTTQPRRTGWTGAAVTAAVVALRLLLAAAAAVECWAWTRAWLGDDDDSHSRSFIYSASTPVAAAALLRQLPERLRLRLPGWLQPVALPMARTAAQAAAATALCVPPWLLLPLCAAAAWASVARAHTAESLLVLRGLGIQTRATGATYLGDAAAWAAWAATSLVSRLLPATWSSATLLPEPRPASTARFIATARLQDLLVNEAFRGFEVRYYLVAVVGGGGSGGGGGSSRRRGWVERCAPISEHANGHGHGHASGEEGAAAVAAAAADMCRADDDDHIVVVFPRLLPGLDIVRTVWREARACLYEPASEKE